MTASPIEAPASPPATYVIREAARAYGVGSDRIARLALAGKVEAVKVDGMWLIDGESLARHLAGSRRPTQPPRPRPPTSFDATPLLRQIELRGGAAACGVAPRSAEERALERARHDGWLTPYAADHLAIKVLGLTLWELWDLTNVA